jgi:hypothetical protein
MSTSRRHHPIPFIATRHITWLCDCLPAAVLSVLGQAAAQHGVVHQPHHQLGWQPAALNSSMHSVMQAAATGTAAGSQRRLQQDTSSRLLFRTGLSLDAARLSDARVRASQTSDRFEAAKGEPARRVLRSRKTTKASEVDQFPVPLWRLAVLPPSFDARDMGVLSPVKNQGRCASCVAFAVTAAAEAAIAAAQPGVRRSLFQQGGLSPQQLYFCQRDEEQRSCRKVRDPACTAGCIACVWQTLRRACMRLQQSQQRNRQNSRHCASAV